MKASPAQAIIAEHEAGMHERRAKDTCKACQKEIQEMAKQSVECVTCGGSYDGTPSGQKKHEATARHREGGFTGNHAVIVQDPVTDGRKAPRITDAASLNAAFPPVEKPVETPAPPEPAKISERSLEGRLDALIVEKSRERDRRVGDHKWRVEHQPAKADAYFADKVQPLLDEIALLKEAMVALKMLQQK